MSKIYLQMTNLTKVIKRGIYHANSLGIKISVLKSLFWQPNKTNTTK